MEYLKNRLDGILDIIPPKSDVLFLDYPHYFNVGDLLIMQGTERFFKDNQINVVGRYNIREYPLNFKISPDVILVFIGGGNFGDIYPWHQRMKEYFVEKYQQNRIVVLPQTIYFSPGDESGLGRRGRFRTQEIFSKHPDLHIFVRDIKSRELALTYKLSERENIRLMPDMAHYLWQLKGHKMYSEDIDSNDVGMGLAGHKRDIKDDKVLYLLRRDVESQFEGVVVDNLGADSCGTIADWDDLITFPYEASLLLTKKLFLLNGMLRDSYLNLGKLPARSFWYFVCNRLVRKSIRMFSGFSHIVSSRLHGHILACLMGIPNTLIDNSYGKNRGYYDLWTSCIPFASFKEMDAGDNLKEAVNAMESLVRKGGTYNGVE